MERDKKPSAGKIYLQLDARESPFEHEYISCVYPVVNQRCVINDSFMVGLPWNMEILNFMYLNIDVQMVNFDPNYPGNSKIKRMLKPNIKPKNILADASNYEVTTIYRKTVHLASYSDSDLTLLQSPHKNPQYGYVPLVDTDANMMLDILPFSSDGLLDDGMRAIL